MRPPVVGPALGIFALGAIAAVATGRWVENRNQDRIEERLRAELAPAIRHLQATLRTYESGLRGARGAIMGGGPDRISRPQFRAYVASRDLAREFPGALGFGFVRRVQPDDVAAFVATTRRDAEPDFALNRFAPHAGELYVIQHIEPIEFNRAALGLDLASEPRRRDAARRAMLTGAPTMSAPVELVQQAVERRGVLMFLPVYRDATAPPTPEAAIGWVYTPVALYDTLTRVQEDHPDLLFDVHDLSETGVPIEISSTPSRAGADAVTTRVTVPLYGRQWQLEARATPRFIARQDLPDPQTAGGIVLGLAGLVSLLLYTVQWNALRRRGLTQAVASSEQRFRDLAESIPQLVWTCAPDGACDYLSPQWIAYTGTPASVQLGHGWLDQLHPDDIPTVRAAWAAAADAGSVLELRFRIRSAGGDHRWFQTRARPIRDAHGELIRWFGTSTDIQALHDAQQATQALADSLEARVLTRTDELRAANHNLDALTRQLKAAQRMTHVGSWELDVASNAVTWSEELYRIAGLDPESPAPDYPAQQRIFSPASWSPLTAAISAAIADGTSYELTVEVTRPDGATRIVITRGEARRSPEGTVDRLVGTFQDVTELTLARRELGQLTERLQLATACARLGVWDWDVRGKFLLWDDAMYDLYGVPPSTRPEAYTTWQARLHPADRAMAEAELAAALRGDREFRPVFRIVRPDGGVRHLRAAAIVHRDPVTGEPLRMVGVNWDVTEQRVTELALREAEAIQRGILAHAGSAMIATTVDGTITAFNRAAEALLGYRADDVLGVRALDSFHDPGEVAARRRAIAADLEVTDASTFEVIVALARRGQVDTNEWTYVHRGGARIPVLLTVSALRDDAGALIGFLSNAVDLTSQKRHEEDLLELNRLLAVRTTQAESASHAKSMFLANMSHEIRTPMNAINGVTYLLRQTSLSREQQTLTEALQGASRSLLGMINDVLDLAKIEAGQLAIDQAPFSLPHVLAQVGALMAGLAVDKPLELIIDSADDVPEFVLGDPVRLTQILNNLIGNAIKFTCVGTVRLTVRVVPGDGPAARVRFEVADTGVGIDPATLGRLFTPFTQADGTAARRASGTGLGLAIVRQLAEAMGGAAGVESAVGIGSVFWVEVPFERELTTPPAPRLAAFDVLLVEPHEAQRAAIAASARQLGGQVEAVASAAEAQARLAARASLGQPFDAVIIEHQFARETLEELRPGPAGSPGAIATAVLVTIGTEPRPRPTPDHDEVLAKPVTRSGLAHALTEAMAKRRGRRAAPTLERRRHRLAGARILVVDDNPINQTVARRILELEGAHVELARDGLQAVEMHRDRPEAFDAILMDVQMPTLDGIEATRRIRDHRAGADVPIVALTAGALDSDRRAALAAGMNEVVAKPFDPEVVIRNVRRQIARARGLALSAAERSERIPTVPDWPACDGVDADDAQRRFSGDAELFIKLFVTAASELETAAARLPTTVGPDDVEALAGQMHALRGMMGNLGARELAQAARDLELALRDHTWPTVVELLPRVQAESARLVRSATGLRDRAAVRTKRPAGTPAPLEVDALAGLLRALEAHDLQALALFSALTPALEQALGPSTFDQLRALLDRLDFAAALEVLRDLERRGDPGLS